MRAIALILWYTLFVDPLTGPITLTSEVHSAWLKALDYIADAGNMESVGGKNKDSKWTQIHRDDALLKPGIVLILKDTQ